MKKIYLPFLIILMSFFIGVVKAESNIFINEITLKEKSAGVVVNKEPVKSGLKMDFDLKFTKVGDYIKYKVLILNRDSEDYTLSSSDKSENGYIKYEYVYENDNKVVVAGSEKVMYVIITYAREIPDELYKDGKYNETHSTNLAFYNNRLPMEEMKKIDNPKTNSASIVLITLAILLSLVISFLLSSRKMRKYLGIFVIGAIIISPLIVYAIETLYITVNTKIEIEKEYTYCDYDIDANKYVEGTYYHGEKWNEHFAKDDVYYSDEDYSHYYFYSKAAIDCYKDIYSETTLTEEEYFQRWSACAQISESEGNHYQVNGDEVIKSKEEGCYHFYMK